MVALVRECIVVIEVAIGLTLVFIRADVFEQFATGGTGKALWVKALVCIDDAANDGMVAAATCHELGLDLCRDCNGRCSREGKPLVVFDQDAGGGMRRSGRFGKRAL
jgi:hypothetical protein